MLGGTQILSSQKIADNLQLSLQHLFDVIKAGSTVKLRKILAAHPALLNAQDPYGYTPLHTAVFARNIEIVKTLVAQGAKLDTPDGDGFPPIAYTRRCPDIKQYLLMNHAENFDPQFSLMHIAVADSDIDAITTLARKRPELLNTKDRAGATPLHLAAEKGDHFMVELLVNLGADLNIVDNKGYPVVALPELDPTIQEFLLNNGAVDPYHNLVQLAASQGDTRKLARLLLNAENQQLINVADLQGLTPLHYAVISGDEAAVALLLKQGADVNAVNNNHYLPIHFAENPDIYKMLLNAGSYDAMATPLHVAASLGDLNQMRAIIAEDPTSVNVLDSQHHTPLRYAADYEKKAAVKLLLAHGANPDIQSLDWQYAHNNPQSLVSNYIRTRTRLPSQALVTLSASFSALIEREIQHAHQLGKKILVVLGELHHNPKIMQVQKRLLGTAKELGINHVLLEAQEGSDYMKIGISAQKLGLSVTGVDNHPKRDLDTMSRAILLKARDKVMANGIYDKNQDAVLILHMDHMPGIVANLREKIDSHRFHIVPINLTSMVPRIPAEVEYTGEQSHYRYDPKQVIQIEDGALSDATSPIALWNSDVLPNPLKLPPEREADETEPKSKRPRKK